MANMTRNIVMLSALLVLTVPALPQSGGQTRSADKIQIISTGHITSVDVKKNTLKVSDTLPVVQNGKRRGPPPMRRHPADFGWGFPGTGANGRGEDPRFPSAPGQLSEYKVFVTSSTILKDNDKIIALSDLKVGDHL